MRLTTIDYVTISIQALLVLAYFCGGIPLDFLFKATAMFWCGYIISACVSKLLARSK